MVNFMAPSLFLPRLDQLVETTAGSAVISAADLRAHARISSTAEDSSVLEPLIATATAYLQDRLRMVFAQSTWTLYLDEFPGAYQGILLPRFPLQSVSDVSYVDPDGNAATFDASDNLLTQVNAKPPYLVLADGSSWPSTRWPLGGVAIPLVMGHATIPPLFKRLVAVLAASMFENREDHETPAPARGFVDMICRNHGMRL